ncbi:MAG: hypothetical protein FWD11_04525 [Micrococcales bacterium]|nr:hypothetical protein [Micrococcales bacterium]
MNDTQKAEVAAILDQVPRLTLEDLETLEYSDNAGFKLRGEARSLKRLSAADASWLEKGVREVVRPVLHSLQGPILSTDSAWIVEYPIGAVLRRDRLTVEQYEAYVRGLRAVGWTIPVHPSPQGPAWADDQVRLAQTVRRDVEDFLAQVATMTEADHQKARELKYAAFVESKATWSLLLMPASDFRWLVDQVRKALRQAEGVAHPTSKEAAARIDETLSAVQRIVCRDKMTPEQYAALTEKYRVVGVRVPAHPCDER